MKILLTSESQIKQKAVTDFFQKQFPQNDILIESKSVNNLQLPEQPLNKGGKLCCKKRLDHVMTLFNDEQLKEYDFIISIENYIDTMKCNDYVYIYFYHNNHYYHVKGNIYVPCDIQLLTQLLYDCKYLPLIENENDDEEILGIEKTYGSIENNIDDQYEKQLDELTGNLIKSENHELTTISNKSDNWMLKYGIDRKDQIIEALQCCYQKVILRNNMTYHQDFPKSGILFENILPIIQNHSTFKILIKLISDTIQDLNIDYIVGLESRGFILGAPLALKMNIGFIPIRKPGKLPRPCFSYSYKKEYGEDTMEMIQDFNLRDKKFVIVDDLIATGGSMEAGIKLCQMNNCQVAKCIVLCQVESLKDIWSKKINPDLLHVLL